MSNQKNSIPEDGSVSAEELLNTLDSKKDTLSPREVAELIRRIVELRREERERKKTESRKQAQTERRRAAAAARAERDAHIAEVTSMDLPLDWENAFGGDPRAEGVHTESIPDGLIRSLTTLGRVDIEYIAEITGATLKEVISTLRGSIYQNPDTWGECFYRGWETAEEYLSGNLVRKWRAAKEANKTYKGYFRENVKALESALPPAVPSEKIYVTLGSPWVPTHVIDAFVNHILKIRMRAYTGTRHDEETGTWELPDKEETAQRNSVAAFHTYGTRRLSALQLIEKALNMRTVSVNDEIPDRANPKRMKSVFNKEETVLALEKQQLLLDEFRSWVFADEARKQELTEIYENKYGCVRRRIFDGSFLQFPTMSDAISLYPYQKNAVARILFSPNTLLAHDVGSGKTYIMIAAGMELRRMGISKKNLYVLPNSLVGQWEGIFRMMYPNAKLLTVGPSQFTPARRGSVLARIRDEEFDGILMAYSCFERIAVSKQHREKEIEETLERLDAVIADPKRATAAARRRRTLLKKELERLTAPAPRNALPGAIPAPAADADIAFDELGITRLFVDEAHNYKNLPIETKSDKIGGISATGSQKCRDMLDKVHAVQKANGGGGVVMATGTPITNSITDAFVMQLYLQSGELALLDLQTFDSWIGMFAERVTEFEIDVDTSGYRLVTRFAKFHNLPELTAILSSVADFHRVGPSAGLPEFTGYTDCLLTRPRELSEYLSDISQRAEAVRGGLVRMKDDNMLKITTDGRKAALDIRLVQENATFSLHSKVARCAENVLTVWRATAAGRSTQLVFCDISTPRRDFNIYDDLRRLLIEGGMPPEEIAFIHDATGTRARLRLFARMMSGEVRVLIGSTFKLGMGVNVQERLIAIHHLDVPWRPSDMTQREGRILRQGNGNERVYIYRYITEGSFDAYSWQILETKQRFITGLLSGSLSERSGSDVEGTVLNYAEVKALAIGNPLVKERVETANLLSRYVTLQGRAVEERLRLEQELQELPARIADQNERVKLCRLDCTFLEEAAEAAEAEATKEPVPSADDLLGGIAAEELLASAPPADTGLGMTEELAAEGGFAELCRLAELASREEPEMLPSDEAKPSTDAESDEKRRKREERTALAARLYLALREHALSPDEIFFEEYRGFRILLPANMDEHRPFVRLAREGKYFLDLGTAEGGILNKIDAFLDGLGEYLAKLRTNLRSLKTRRDGIKEELAKDNDYAARIDELTAKLQKIDKKLGVAS